MTQSRRDEVAPLEVDRDSLLELARGANLYTTRFAFVRELVQNAVDATLLRLFAELGPERFPTHEGSLRDLRRLLEAYPIDVRVERIAGGPRDPTRVYRVVVEDRGIGVHRDDVPHLQRIGSSRKNPRRAQLIAAMPEWMRPSGAFGVGLQSVFLVSRAITLSSRPLDGEPIEVRIEAGDGGTVRVRSSDRATVGTRASLEVTLEGEQGSIWSHLASTGVQDWLERMDQDAELGGVLHLVRTMGSGGLVPITINGEPIPREGRAGYVFDPETLLEVYLPVADDAAEDPGATTLDDAVVRWERRATSGFYRGAPVRESLDDLLTHVYWALDVHFGTAREMLRLDRESLSPPGGAELRRRVHAFLDRRLPKLAASVDPASHCAAWYAAHLLERGRSPHNEAWRRVRVGCTRGPHDPPISLDDVDAHERVALEGGAPGSSFASERHASGSGRVRSTRSSVDSRPRATGGGSCASRGCG